MTHLTTEETARLHKVFALIATEQDHSKFTELVRELNCLLDRKDSQKHPLRLIPLPTDRTHPSGQPE